MRIRAEHRADRPAVRALVESAFGQAVEADLVAALRRQATPLISLVAEDQQAITGHILFSPVELTGHPELSLMGLAPMAVSPDRQRGGIGSALVRAGLEECRRLGRGAVVVLGHPQYYPRFGFQPTRRYSITSEYDVPAEVFMLLELEPGYLRGARGTIRYHPAFAAV